MIKYYKLTPLNNIDLILSVYAKTEPPVNENPGLLITEITVYEYYDFKWTGQTQYHFFNNKVMQFFTTLLHLKEGLITHRVAFDEFFTKLVEYTQWDGHKIPYVLTSQDLRAINEAVGLLTSDGKQAAMDILDFGNYVEIKEQYPNILSKIFFGLFGMPSEDYPVITEDFDRTKYPSIRTSTYARG